MDAISIFERYAQEYDEWFEENRFIYESELRALDRFIPKNSKGIEIGVGTGRFSALLGIKVGVEPSKAMAEIARRRGIMVYEAKAEALPFGDSSFDFVLIVVTICFVQDPVIALKEAKRILRPGGSVIIGIIDKESFLGKLYEAKKAKSKFYKVAKFYSTGEVLSWLRLLKFTNIKTCQTIFRHPDEITSVEPVKEGYGEGGFVAICAHKQMEGDF